MMLRCERCAKPVLLMTGEAEERYRERPSAYQYLCIECRGEVALGDDIYGDAGG